MSISRFCRAVCRCCALSLGLAGIGCGGLPVDPTLDDDGIARTFVSFATSDTTVAGATAEQVPEVDVMDLKLNQAIQTLLSPGFPEELYKQAIDEVIESLYVSNLVPLPSGGPAEVQEATKESFARNEGATDQAIQAFSVHHAEIGTPTSQAEAAEARNFLQLTREAMAVIAEETTRRNAANLSQAGPILRADDEGGRTLDEIWPHFGRQVRSPFFFPLVADVGNQISEQVIVPDAIGPGECAVIVKEIQGIKVVVRPLLIPIWVEPWNARARIVGQRKVWIWEFVPAEFIKTLEYCNVDGDVVQDIHTITVLDRALLHFWRFLDKDVQLGP